MADKTCEQCGLPLTECTALAVGRLKVEAFLRLSGYSGRDARAKASELVPHPRRSRPPACTADAHERLRAFAALALADMNLPLSCHAFRIWGQKDVHPYQGLAADLEKVAGEHQEEAEHG